MEISAGLTPRLFAAAILSQYGSIISGIIKETAEALSDCDEDLGREIEKLESGKPESPEKTTSYIRSLNRKLIAMNRQLTGTRSSMHYLAESADVLVSKITPFDQYVQARLKDWGNRCSEDELRPDLGALEAAFHQLDSCKERIRDNDKLVMVRKSMQQHKTDIKSLQQHIDINVGMVCHAENWFVITNDHHPNICIVGA